MDRKSRFTLSMVVIMLLFTPRIILAGPAPDLVPLKPLSGKWVGKGDGTNGPFVVKQIYPFLLGGSHFQSKSTARFKPKDNGKPGQIQKTTGVFSFDPIEKSILYREFTSDGQMRLYKLIKVSKDGLTLTFQINAKKVNRVRQQNRLTFTVKNKNHLQETVSQTADGKTFKQLEHIVLRRVKRKKINRPRKKLKNKGVSVDLN